MVDGGLRDLIPLFMTQRKTDQATLARALAEGDFESIRRVGHAMNGVGTSYGFDFVSELGQRIELAARRADAGELGRLKRELDDYLERLVVKYL